MQTDPASLIPSRFGQPPTDPAERIPWLEGRARAMRAQGLAGHWAYDLALHRNLLSVLEAERAALPAEKCLPASPDRQHARAA
jgi:hypothetical protein